MQKNDTLFWFDKMNVTLSNDMSGLFHKMLEEDKIPEEFIHTFKRITSTCK